MACRLAVPQECIGVEKRENAKKRKKQKIMRRKADSANQDVDPDSDELVVPYVLPQNGNLTVSISNQFL